MNVVALILLIFSARAHWNKFMTAIRRHAVNLVLNYCSYFGMRYFSAQNSPFYNLMLLNLVLAT